MTSQLKIPSGIDPENDSQQLSNPSDNKRNLTITLDVLHDYCTRSNPDTRHDIGDFINWLRNRQRTIPDENVATIIRGIRFIP